MCHSASCKLAYGDDCMTYLTCVWTRYGFHGTKNVCSHGTFFARDLANVNVSCVQPADARCPTGMFYKRWCFCLLKLYISLNDRKHIYDFLMCNSLAGILENRPK